MTEFGANNQIATAKNVTPFFANYGYHSRMNLEQQTHATTPKTMDAKRFANAMLRLQEYLRTQMNVAQVKYEISINKHRTPAHAYQVGDKVLLSTNNICTARAARKFDWKRLGPNIVDKVISPYSYRVQLPSTVHLYPVFHVSLLDPAPNDHVAGQLIPPPPPVVIDDVLEYEIEEVLDSKVARNRLRYYVK